MIVIRLKIGYSLRKKHIKHIVSILFSSKIKHWNCCFGVRYLEDFLVLMCTCLWPTLGKAPNMFQRCCPCLAWRAGNKRTTQRLTHSISCNIARFFRWLRVIHVIPYLDNMNRNYKMQWLFMRIFIFVLSTLSIYILKTISRLRDAAIWS